jgi:hypothetical protein
MADYQRPGYSGPLFFDEYFLLPLACVIKTESRKGRRAYFLPGS